MYIYSNIISISILKKREFHHRTYTTLPYSISSRRECSTFHHPVPVEKYGRHDGYMKSGSG